MHIHMNDEVFTAEEIQFLRLATGAVHFLAQQEMENEDYTETAVMLAENAPVVMRKLDRLLKGEEVDPIPFVFEMEDEPELWELQDRRRVEESVDRMTDDPPF